MEPSNGPVSPGSREDSDNLPASITDLITKSVNMVHSGIFIYRYLERDQPEIIWSNNRYREWLEEYMGSKEMTSPGLQFSDFLLEEDKVQFAKSYLFFLRNPYESYRNIYHRVDGDRNLWLFLNAIVIEHGKGKIPGKVVVMITDLTSEIESEVRLNNVLQQNSRVKKKYKDLSLTRRQREVLGLIANGYTNKAIAEKLHISSHTVDTHRKNLLEKFNINNTATLVRIFLELGIELQ